MYGYSSKLINMNDEEFGITADNDDDDNDNDEEATDFHINDDNNDDLSSDRDVTIPILPIPIPMVLFGIGIGIHAHILLILLFSQDNSTMRNTKKSLSFSSSILPRELRRKVFLRTANGKYYTSFPQ